MRAPTPLRRLRSIVSLRRRKPRGAWLCRPFPWRWRAERRRRGRHAPVGSETAAVNKPPAETIQWLAVPGLADNQMPD